MTTTPDPTRPSKGFKPMFVDPSYNDDSIGCKPAARKTTTEVRAEGFIAACDRVPKVDCPYRHPSPYREYWMLGWEEADRVDDGDTTSDI